MANSSSLVVFRGGFSARCDVVERLLDIESRGGRFVPQPDGRFKVEPASLLTPDDRAFIREHRDEARRVLQYQADDRHLWNDRGQAQPGHVAVATEVA